MPSGQMLLNPTLRRALAVQETPDSAVDTPVAAPVTVAAPTPAPTIPISNPIIQQALTAPTTPVVNAQVPNTTDAALSVGEPTKQPDQITPTLPAVIANPQVMIPQTTVDTTPAHGPASAAAQANAPVDPVTGLPVAAAGPATVAADIQQGKSVTPEQIAIADAMQNAQVAANQGGGLNAILNAIVPALAIGGTAAAFAPELLSALGGGTTAAAPSAPVAAATDELAPITLSPAATIQTMDPALASLAQATTPAVTAAANELAPIALSPAATMQTIDPTLFSLGQATTPAAIAATDELAPITLSPTATPLTDVGANFQAALSQAGQNFGLTPQLAGTSGDIGTDFMTALQNAGISPAGTDLTASTITNAITPASLLPTDVTAAGMPTSIQLAPGIGMETIDPTIGTGLSDVVVTAKPLDYAATMGAADVAGLAAPALTAADIAAATSTPPNPNYPSSSALPAAATSALSSAAKKFLQGLLGGAGTGTGTGTGTGSGGGTAAAAQPFQAPAIPTQNIPQAYEYVMQNYAGPQTLPLGQYAANAPQVSLPQYQAPQAAQQGGIMDVTGSNMDQGQLAALMAALQGQQNG